MAAIQTDASCIRRTWRLSATIRDAPRPRMFPRGITSFPGRSFEHYPDQADREPAVPLKADRAFPSPGRRAKPASGSVVQGSAVTLIAALSACGLPVRWHCTRRACRCGAAHMSPWWCGHEQPALGKRTSDPAPHPAAARGQCKAAGRIAAWQPGKAAAHQPHQQCASKVRTKRTCVPKSPSPWPRAAPADHRVPLAA